jgi:hypothetical protein
VLGAAGDGVVSQFHFGLPPELESIGAAEGLTGTGRLCLICLMFAKGDQVDATRPTWEPLARDPDMGKPPVRIPWGRHGFVSPIAEAVVPGGVSDIMPGLPLMPLCWDHLAAITRPKQDQPAAPHVPGVTLDMPPGFRSNGRPRGRG